MSGTRQVIGTLRTPDGAAFLNRTLTWYRARRKAASQGGYVIVDEPFLSATDSEGAVNLQVFPGLYLVKVPLKDEDRCIEVGIEEGEGAFDIADGVQGAAPPITPVELQQARDARDEALAAVASLGHVVAISQADYDALDPPEQGTLYAITDTPEPFSIGGIKAVAADDLPGIGKQPALLYLGLGEAA